MDKQSLYNMYMGIAELQGEDAATEWAENNLTDGELKTLKAYIAAQKMANRRNWHVQDFRYIEFPK